MVRPRPLIAVLWLILAVSRFALAENPKVVSFEPVNGATTVDPATTELRVTFDQDMRKAGHSICGGGPAFPRMQGKPTWVDARTLVIKVSLDADHEYQMSLNCPAAQNFASAKGEVLRPTQWRFSTAGKRSPHDQRQLNKRSFDELTRILKDNYSYYDRKKLDWKGLERKNASKIESAKSTGDWVKRVAKMLAPAEDPHLWMSFGGNATGTSQRKFTPNFNIKGVEKVAGKLTKRNENVYTADLPDGIFYLLIPSLDHKFKDQIAQVDNILKEQKTAKGIILDVRANGGGDEALGWTIAGWFVKGTHTYSKNATRDPSAKGGFGPVNERRIKGNSRGKRYDGPVAVLMGPMNLSSCESFLLMMKQGRQVKLIGDKSGGSSGNPKKFSLANGVDIFVPSWKDFLPDGSLLEGRGIKPDIRVNAKAKDFETGDPVIERALQDLRTRMKR